MLDHQHLGMHRDVCRRLLCPRANGKLRRNSEMVKVSPSIWLKAKHEQGKANLVLSAAGGLLVACCVVTVGLVIVEIVQLAHERLGPALHLCSSLLKILIWIVCLLVALLEGGYSSLVTTSMASLIIILLVM